MFFLGPAGQIKDHLQHTLFLTWYPGSLEIHKFLQPEQETQENDSQLRGDGVGVQKKKTNNNFPPTF